MITAALALTAAAMTLAAAFARPDLAAAAAVAAFAIIAISTFAFARAESLTIQAASKLCALVYAWGAAAMLGVYLLSGLWWQHGWQYGLAMALISAGLFVYARSPRAAGPAEVALTAAHALAAAGALAFLITSGKLWAGKTDWAANQIFLAGGAAIIVVCTLSALAQRRTMASAS